MTGLYKIKTVAERSGFSANLLRAWERRYDFLEPDRQASGHRLYSEKDLRVLRSVKQLLDQGYSVGEAAAMGREALLRLTMPRPSARPLSSSTERQEALPKDKQVTDLLEAAGQFEVESSRRLIREIMESCESRVALRKRISAISTLVGDLWARGELSVAVEHFLSGLWKESLRADLAQMSEPREDAETVVLAGFPDEFHELGLLLLQAEFQHSGYRVINLGPALPWESLEQLLAKKAPRFVCLSVTRPALLAVHLPRFSELVARQVGTTFVVGGPGTTGMEQSLSSIGVLCWTTDMEIGLLSEEMKNGSDT